MFLIPPSNNLSLEQFLQSLELQIKDLTIEIGVAVSLSKEILLVKEGEVSKISFLENEKTQIKIVSLHIITHRIFHIAKQIYQQLMNIIW